MFICLTGKTRYMGLVRGFDEPVSNPEKVKKAWERHLKDGYAAVPRRNAYEEMVAEADEWNRSNEKEIIEFEFDSHEREAVTVPLSVTVDSLGDVPDVDGEGGPDEEIELESVLEAECGSCSGSGVYCSTCGDSGEVSCTERNCDGGIIKLDCDVCDYNNEVSETCPECDGSGYSLKQQCNKCNGTERVYDPDKERKVKCTVCDHGVYKEYCNNCSRGETGEVKKDCPNCGGDGKVKKGQCTTCSQYSDTYRGKIPCSDCNGGDAPSDCDECDGEGQVREVTIHTITREDTETREVTSFDIPKSSRLSQDVEYETVITEEYDSLAELKSGREASVDEKPQLPDDITDDINVDEITKINYEYMESQRFVTYRYKQSDGVKEYVTRHRGLLDSNMHYRPLKSAHEIVSVSIEEDGTVIDPSDTSDYLYVTGLKYALVNMSSSQSYTELKSSEKLPITTKLTTFLPATALKVIRSPGTSLRNGVITLALSAGVIPYVLYVERILQPSIDSVYQTPIGFATNYTGLFIGLTVLLFTVLTMWHKIRG